MSVFYLPKDGVCGDFIPYYNEERKVFELYYLHDYRGCNGHGEGTDWRRITTTDGAHYTEEGEMISRGGPESRDLFCYTGCVVIHGNIQHIFYTGHNYHLMETGGRKEAVTHAVSTDGIHWEKREDLTFFAPEGLDIELNDWRDPYVFWNEDEHCWWMLLCTRKKTGPDRLRGATGLLKSGDLDHWEYCGSFWSPSNCWCPECPEIFRWGNYWYFIYSTYNEAEGFRTYYRMAQTLAGPWKAPSYNTFDGRAFYAGKTACDGENRYIFGWNPTKERNSDFGVWQWGGCLVTHQLVQLPDGQLRVKMPEKIHDLFESAQALHFEPMLHGSSEEGDVLSVSALDGFGAAMTGSVPGACKLEAEILLEAGTRDAGFVLHCDDNGDEGYYLRLEADHGKLAFQRIHPQCDHNEIERKIDIDTGVWHRLTVLLDGDAVTAYLDDLVGLSARMYDYTGSRLMAFVSDGSARFCNVRVSALKNREEA